MNDELKAKLIDAVIEQIKHDITVGEVSCISELLSSCSTGSLIGYLPEEIGNEFEPPNSKDFIETD